jgi:hypothetical protein
VHLDIIKVFYSPTDAQVNCLKNNFKIYIKIDIKRIMSNALPDNGVTALKHVSAVLKLILMKILKLFLRHFTCASIGE